MANHDSNNGGGTVMLAFLVGALTGAAVALLFAPASGEETREYLGQKAREGRARAREAVEQGREVYQRQRDNSDRAPSNAAARRSSRRATRGEHAGVSTTAELLLGVDRRRRRGDGDRAGRRHRRRPARGTPGRAAWRTSSKPASSRLSPI